MAKGFTVKAKAPLSTSSEDDFNLQAAKELKSSSDDEIGRAHV